MMTKNDVQLQSDVCAELAWDPSIEDTDIHVLTTDGVVTLVGSVPSYADKRAAERDVERVFGVKAVANELTVAVPERFQRTDTGIARAVVDALAWDVQVPDTKVKATVTNGWVTLDGDVEWRYERDAAARAVRNLAGVRGVTNNIKITAKHISSREVSKAIKEALERRADRTAERITVEAVGSVVTLTGRVPSVGDRRAAEGAAWSAPGVTDVHDKLAVTGWEFDASALRVQETGAS
jgi:VCBS repeat-containing protein